MSLDGDWNARPCGFWCHLWDYMLTDGAMWMIPFFLFVMVCVGTVALGVFK